MIYLGLPTGPSGAGIRGDNICEALHKRAPVERLLPDQPETKLSGPLLQSAPSTLRPRWRLEAPRRVGYAVFHDDIATGRSARKSSGFDCFVTASRWGEQVLRDAGLRDVRTVHTGVDIDLFNPQSASRTAFTDRFVVYSGGKLELRKAQDVVLEAFRIFSQRHAEAILVASWDNPSIASVKTMLASPILRPMFDGRYKTFDELLRGWVSQSGVDPTRVKLMPRVSQAEMASIYANTDVGLFPNRCEGGTNMVMMEYMACGRPVIATAFAGQREIVADDNSFCLRHWQIAPFVRHGEVVGCMCQPSLDEILNNLEVAFSDRDKRLSLGRKAANDLRRWTWDRTADELLSTLQI